MTMAMAVEWAVRGAIPAGIAAATLLLLRAQDPRLEQRLWRSALVFACVMPLLTMFVAVVRMATKPGPQMSDAALTGVFATAGTERTPVTAMAAISGDEILRSSIIIWGAISTVLLGRLVIGAIGAWRLRRSSAAVDASVTTDRRVRVSTTLRTPATVGSTVLLPSDIMHWSMERRNAVIAHELAHVEHGDFWWQLLARTYAAICWWNPAAWLFVSRLRWLAERLSDTAALRVMPDRRAYAELLVDVAARTRNAVPALHVAMARPAMLRQRVETVLQQVDGRRLTGVRRMLALALPLCGASLATLTPMPRTELALTSLGARGQTPIAAVAVATDTVTIRLHSSPDETSSDPAIRARTLSAPRSKSRIPYVVLNADGGVAASGQTPTMIILPVTVPFSVTYCAAEPGTALLADFNFKSGTGGTHSAECFEIFRELDKTGSRGVRRPRR